MQKKEMMNHNAMIGEDKALPKGKINAMRTGKV
jgi:hypothetical protein